MNKKLKLMLLGGAMFALAAIGVNLSLDRTSNWNLIMKNVNALANDEGTGNAIPRYFNKTDIINQVEHREEVDKNGVKITYKRTCQAIATYCKHTRNDKDVCYVYLNGVETLSCGSWELE